MFVGRFVFIEIVDVGGSLNLFQWIKNPFYCKFSSSVSLTLNVFNVFVVFATFFSVTLNLIMLLLFNFYKVLNNKKKNILKPSNYMCW